MWAHVCVTLLGCWLMAAPAALDYVGQPIEFSDRIIGPLLASLATIAWWQIARPLRWVNFVCGLWLLAAPWALSAPWDATINSMAVGLLAAALSLVHGKVDQPMGGGWSSLWCDSNAKFPV